MDKRAFGMTRLFYYLGIKLWLVGMGAVLAAIGLVKGHGAEAAFGVAQMLFFSMFIAFDLQAVYDEIRSTPQPR